MTDQSPLASSSRRGFLKASSAAAAVGALAISPSVSAGAFASGDDTIKVGLIGCGGRGTSAAGQALRADKQARLVAMGDAFGDRIEGSLKGLARNFKKQVAVDAEHKFVGFDAYKEVIAASDVVLLATPPHFRPAHLRAAIEAGKHVFCEKPVAVDAPGIRSVLETTELAHDKELTLVSGLCWRYHNGMRATFNKVKDGAIGDITAMQCSYNTNGLWQKPRKPEWSDMEWQVRNWLYFTWLSGDFNTEQHVHSLDKMTWAMNDAHPVSCSGTGGRQVRTGAEYGHIYDHFAIVYEYANGVKAFSRCRQQDKCKVDVSDHLFGTKGRCDVFAHATYDWSGKETWKFKDKKNNMYQTEHDEMFAAIRKGKPINNGVYMARSTMLAIMGRMAAYTGQTITWDQAMNSKEKLGPDKYEWGDLEVPPVAMPGKTKFV